TFASAAPTTPSHVTATAASATSVQLTWDASSETGGTIASYQISRNGTPLTSVPGSATSYPDSTAQPGTSNTVTTPLLTTGFETGNLSGWSPVAGQVAVQAGVVHAGSYAAQLSSTGGQTFALQTLPGSSSTLYAQGWINVASQSTTMTLFGLRTQASGSTPAYQVAQVYLNSSGT